MKREILRRLQTERLKRVVTANPNIIHAEAVGVEVDLGEDGEEEEVVDEQRWKMRLELQVTYRSLL